MQFCITHIENINLNPSTSTRLKKKNVQCVYLCVSGWGEYKVEVIIGVYVCERESWVSYELLYGEVMTEHRPD